jgi:YggT family protein
MRFIHDLINLYILILVAAALLSWFPTQNSSGGLASAKRVLARLTEPILRPLRAVLPRPSVGGVGIDFSVLVALIALEVINSII